MPGSTDALSLPYPLPDELLRRQNIQDLAEACAFVLDSANVDRLAALQRPRGVLGSVAANSFTSDAVGYMSWNIDHLDYWFGGGRAITATQGPTLPTGLYLFQFNAVRTAMSAAETSYAWTTAEFERGGSTRTVRRTFTPGQRAIRLTAPVRIPSGAAQQVRMRILVNGTVGGSTMAFGRDWAEASPRLSWVQLAQG